MIAISNPFDLRGPEFLLFFIALLAGAMLASLLLMQLVRASTHESGGEPELDAYEMAYLAGGTARVQVLAIARLLDRDQVSISSSELRIAPTQTADHAVERAILADAPVIPLRRLRSAIAPACVTIGQTLERQGLLVGRDAMRFYRLGIAMIFTIVLGTGIAKIAIGISRNRPVGFLVALTAVSLVFGLALICRGALRTAAGARVIGRHRDEFPRSNAYQAYSRGEPTEDADFIIALWGSAALVGHSSYPQLRSCMSAVGGDGGSFSGCGGSSCGGGGCGGGGCGGCGGG